MEQYKNSLQYHTLTDQLPDLWRNKLEICNNDSLNADVHCAVRNDFKKYYV